MTEANETKMYTKEEWNAQRTEKWRAAYIDLVNSLDASTLAGMFVTLNGDASVIPILIPRYSLEEAGMDEDADTADISKFWNSLPSENKRELLDDSLNDDISLETVDRLDKAFMECVTMDELFEDKEEEILEEETCDDDEAEFIEGEFEEDGELTGEESGPKEDED